MYFRKKNNPIKTSAVVSAIVLNLYHLMSLDSLPHIIIRTTLSDSRRLLVSLFLELEFVFVGWTKCVRTA